jgi:hypothetical protein
MPCSSSRGARLLLALKTRCGPHGERSLSGLYRPSPARRYNRRSMALPLRLIAVIFTACMLVCSAQAQQHAEHGNVTLPAGTPLAVATAESIPMRVDAPIRANTLYPVYASNQLVLPAGTLVIGNVVSLVSAHAARVDARLGGDFTPLHRPVVHFTAIVLPSGVEVPVTTGTAADGAPIYRVVAPKAGRGGLIHQGYEDLRKRAHDTVAIVTGPDKADRAKQFVYSQLPYHPQRIDKGTAWTVETSAPLRLPIAVQQTSATPADTKADPKVWLVWAYLAHAMTSASAKPGEEIQAKVAQPVLNADGSIAVPQGSILSGTITQARPARTFGRSARLRFRFTQLTLPGAAPQHVRTALTQLDSNQPDTLSMNNEGVVKPKPRDKLAVPLILLAAAVQPLDTEQGHDALRKSAVASNSLGLIGFIVGTAAQQANVAAGIGFYGTAISLYQRLIRRGPEVMFARNTRIVVQTTPSAEPLKPAQP